MASAGSHPILSVCRSRRRLVSNSEDELPGVTNGTSFPLRGASSSLAQRPQSNPRSRARDGRPRITRECVKEGREQELNHGTFPFCLVADGAMEHFGEVSCRSSGSEQNITAT
jgi:hypothetical protein